MPMPMSMCHRKCLTIICLVFTINIIVLILAYHYDRRYNSAIKTSSTLKSAQAQEYQIDITRKGFIKYITAKQDGFHLGWAKSWPSKKNITGYKIWLWELQNVTGYRHMKDNDTHLWEWTEETRYPKTKEEWENSYQKRFRKEWIVLGRDNTEVTIQHNLKSYTWYDLEIGSFSDTGDGPSYKNNRFKWSE